MAYNKFIYNRGTTRYKDFDISFLPNPSTGDLRVKTDVDAIKKSIELILFTSYGERPFREDLSGDLYNLLFEPLDAVTTINLQRNILYTLRAYEPRINVNDVEIDDSNMSKNELKISIYFTILNTQVEEKIDVFLRRTR